jgi:hypothetical protein
MIRLGLRLTLHSGREAFTRLLLTTVAVALGVAVLLGVLAEFHAFQADANRSCWECTQGAPVPKALSTLAPAARAGRGAGQRAARPGRDHGLPVVPAAAGG